jgi:putative transposase
MITERITDTGIMEITDEQLLLDITDLLGREFVCYGYKKVCKYLQRSGYIINRKKVFRIMGENNLLNYRYNYRSPARRVVESIVSVQKPNDVWEMDIKYVYIHGENRTAYLFAIIDCYTREVVGKHIGYHCTSQDVKMAIDFAFLDRGIMQIKNVRIRSDNGTQFVSRIVELFLSSCNIAHERIHPATPKEDAHIESFNSILEKEVIRRFEFSSFEDAENTISRFIAFYNNERLHSAIDYRTPREVYEKWKENIIEGSA